MEFTAEHIETMPQRGDAPPATSRVIPHLQLEQFTSQDLVDELVDSCLRLQHVRCKESRIATPSTVALWIPDDFARGPKEAFLDDHEFCHIHASPHGSIHLTLPREVRERVNNHGWGEPHAMATPGFLPESTYLVYAPRNRFEKDIVGAIVKASYCFARGISRYGL